MQKRITSKKERESFKKIRDLRKKDSKNFSQKDINNLVIVMAERAGLLKRS